MPVIDAAVGELRERLGGVKSVDVAVGTVRDLTDLAQGELVQIQLEDRKE